jgi:hypothetical protein
MRYAKSLTNQPITCQETQLVHALVWQACGCITLPSLKLAASAVVMGDLNLDDKD